MEVSETSSSSATVVFKLASSSLSGSEVEVKSNEVAIVTVSVVVGTSVGTDVGFGVGGSVGVFVGSKVGVGIGKFVG